MPETALDPFELPVARSAIADFGQLYFSAGITHTGHITGQSRSNRRGLPAPSVSCGTIHRFQGKEADVVFLVLGGNPTSQGARDWVSEKPNMLNVALTRARKRFYVIGNKSLWGNCSYFNIMAAKLPVINILN